MAERSPTNPHAFDEHKLSRELVQRNVELYTAHQADTRHRVDTLAKAIFVLSGGSLTVALGIFLRESAPALSPDQTLVLRVALWALFAGMAGFAVILGVMITQAYSVGSNWERQLKGQAPTLLSKRLLPVSQIFNWTVGVVAFLSFLLGLGALAWLASSIVGK
jgi:hypothetical protein